MRFILLFQFALLLSGPFILRASSPDDESIRKYLSSQLPGYEQIGFEVVTTPRDFPLIQIDTTSSLKTSGVFAYIPVIIRDKKNNPSRSIITLRLKLYKYVYTAAGDIDRGKELRKEDFSFGIKDVANIRGTVPGKEFTFSNYRSRRLITQGEVLRNEDMEKLPLIKTGDKVNAVSIHGNVEASVGAEAKQEGGEGDIIRITTNNGSVLRARVIDSLNVLIID